MDFPFRRFFLVTCCWTGFALVLGEMGALPPPSRVSLVFTNDFCMNLSWNPPENLTRSICSVKYFINVTTEKDSTRTLSIFTHHKECMDVENGVTFAVQTQCGLAESEEVVMRIPQRTEKLVKDFKCLLYTPGDMNCTWRSTDKTRDLQLYYWFKNMKQAFENCGLYLYSGADRTGCHLHGNFLSFTNIFFLLNGTRGPSALKNTFQVIPRDHMKPHPPKLRVSKEGNKLGLHCDPPGGFDPDCWSYEYRYSSSKSAGWQEVSGPRVGAEVEIPYDWRLQYQVQAKAVSREICGRGFSDWSEVMSVGEEQPPDWSSHMVLIAIPVVVTVCVILFLIFFKKVRVMILPQIPDPMNLFKELINSKEEGVAAGSPLTENLTVLQGKSSEKQKLYVPEEAEVCMNVRVEKHEPTETLRP